MGVEFLASSLLEVLVAEEYPGEATAILRQAAQNGYADVDLRLGLSLLTGQGVKRDLGAAKAYLLAAAGGGSEDAMFMLGQLAEVQDGEFLNEAYDTFDPEGYGRGYMLTPCYEESLRLAFPWYRKAADAGSVQAQLRFGYLLMENIFERSAWRGEFDEGHALLARMAEEGNAEAAVVLGVRLLLSDRARSEGASLLRRAIDIGFDSAASSYRAIARAIDGPLATGPEALYKLGLVRDYHRDPAASYLSAIFLIAEGKDWYEDWHVDVVTLLAEAVEGDIADSIVDWGRAMLRARMAEGRIAPEFIAAVFEQGYNRGSARAGVMLAYMTRRGEAKSLHTFDDLLRDGLAANVPEAMINQALALGQGHEAETDYEQADAIMRRLTWKQAGKCVSWWAMTASYGDPEGDLIIGWLAALGVISDSEGFTGRLGRVSGPLTGLAAYLSNRYSYRG